MKNILLILVFAFTSFGNTSLWAQDYKSYKLAQDSFVRYLDTFLRMNPDFDLEFNPLLRQEEYSENFSGTLELDSLDWNPHNEFPEFFTTHADLIGVFLAESITNYGTQMKFQQYFTKVEVFCHGKFWLIHVNCYLK